MRQIVGTVVLAAALCGCSIAQTPAAAPPPPPPPPPPPAACLLDTGTLATTTGLTWAPDATTASDTRCVYDAGSPRPAEGPAFLAVDITQDSATTLDTVAELCEDGSRAPVGTTGFVCRYQGGNVFAAVTHDGRLVTLAASAVPAGTTAAQLVVAFDQQVTALAG